MWHFHFKVPNEVVHSFQFTDAKRVICKLNNKVEFHCALMPNGKGGYFINVNKEIRSQLKLDIGSNVDVSLILDESKYGMPISAEFEACLNEDSEANTIFESLTPGKKRTLIHIINVVKNSDKKIAKSIVILEHLKIKHGKIDFKMLNEMFKAMNN